jgi:hypothetical protein
VVSIQNDKDNVKNLLNGLKALENQVNAQSGKKIPVDIAKLLLDDIKYLTEFYQ